MWLQQTPLVNNGRAPVRILKDLPESNQSLVPFLGFSLWGKHGYHSSVFFFFFCTEYWLWRSDWLKLLGDWQPGNLYRWNPCCWKCYCVHCVSVFCFILPLKNTLLIMLRAELQRRIQAMEMRYHREILRISYKDLVTNKEVRAKVQQAIGHTKISWPS